MHPRCLLPDVHELQHVRVQPGSFQDVLKGGEVHPRCTAGDHHVVQILLRYGVYYYLLSWFGAEILVVSCVDDSLPALHRFQNSLYVHDVSYVSATLADVDPDSWRLLHLCQSSVKLEFRIDLQRQNA